MSGLPDPNQHLISNDPTILALRRTLDLEVAAFNSGEGSTDHLVNAIYACLPHDCVECIVLPASGTLAPSLALRVGKQDHYLAFAAEYWAAIVHGNTPRERINPDQRIARMRAAFEKDRSVSTDDYAYFTTPRESIRPNKAARKSAERSERQSRERSETPSSDRTGD
jgi:hypothetical protein